MRMPVICSFFFMIVAGFASAGQPSYLVYELSGMPADAVSSSVSIVMDDGRCYGVWVDDAGEQREFVWCLEPTTDYPAGFTEVVMDFAGEHGDVNNNRAWAKQVWGWSEAGQEHVPHAGLWISGGAEFAIGSLGGEMSASRGISDDGLIVGWSKIHLLDSNGNQRTQGFIWDDVNGMVAVPAMSGYEHMSLNDVQPMDLIAVGTAWNNSTGVWAPMGHEITYDDSVGVYLDENDSPVLLDELLPSGSAWQISGANSVNSHRWIGGSAMGSDGLIHAVLLVPNKADPNQDGVIDVDDLTGFVDSFTGALSIADLNNDGQVDGVDFTLFLEDYEAGATTGTTGNLSAGPSARPVPVNCPRLLNECGRDCKEWNGQNAGKYDPECNPQCYGCSGCDDNNTNKPDGAPGWPGSDPKNPDAPNGGPGGTGCASGGLSNFETPGNGGAGGDGADGGHGGRGGDGGEALDGSGLAGGNGGAGGDGGEDGNGGDGGAGGKGDGNAPGGSGGHGGQG
ncbi:MAG: GC-type dockerin domain-anchored protein, partial [Phycisphaerales bacterium]